MSNLVWLASYPKSGNTWFRVFLANLRSNAALPVDINRLTDYPIASSRALFDEATGLAAADLTHDEIERLRPRVYEHLAAQAREVRFLKIHDAFTLTSEGEPQVSRPAAAKAVYFIRNPLDVAVSFAHHSSKAVDEVIAQMADEQLASYAKPGRLHLQLRQLLTSWRRHVLSWVEAPGLCVHVVRYEDMKQQPMETFSAAVRFAEMSYGVEKIQRALAFSAFEEMQRQEQAHGFAEKQPEAKSFFRAGKAGGWRGVLTPPQVERIIRDQGDVMRRFGYLNANGDVVD